MGPIGVCRPCGPPPSAAIPSSTPTCRRRPLGGVAPLEGDPVAVLPPHRLIFREHCHGAGARREADGTVRPDACRCGGCPWRPPVYSLSSWFGVAEVGQGWCDTRCVAGARGCIVSRPAHGQWGDVRCAVMCCDMRTLRLNVCACAWL